MDMPKFALACRFTEHEAAIFAMTSVRKRHGGLTGSSESQATTSVT